MTYEHNTEIAYSIRGATHIVPVIMQIFGKIESLVDVGGGSGAWLREFMNCGVTNVRLIDSASVKNDLLIPESCLEATDLRHRIPDLSGFQVAICLECAEHLPPHRGQELVAALRAVPCVIWSAAVPGQGGIGHVNEQPHWYWDELFFAQGFEKFDVIRPLILKNTEIPYWYRQNLCIYAHGAARARFAQLQRDLVPDEFQLIHHRALTSLLNPGIAESLRILVGSIGRAVARRLPSRQA